MKDQTVETVLEQEEKENQAAQMTNEEVEVLENNKVTEENEETESSSIEQDEVTLLNKQVEELQNRLLRVQADFDNYKRRTKQEKDELGKYANVKLIEALLPTYDNFDRAIQSALDTKNLESFVQGVQMIYKQVEDVLSKEGLEPIEAVGKPFNPEFHQAIMQVETDEFESGYVVEELQKGYKIKDRVIRPSMVKVNA